ncbi:MAG: hypothetical protein PHV06_12365, partial [bacterium]|nr:hypothetical protein [bacterium]
IIIESKGIEVAEKVKISPYREIISQRLKSSIFDGIEQGISIAKFIKENKKINNITFGNKENYLLIITYKELYVGTCNNFKTFFAKEKVESIYKQNPGSKYLPIENIFFLSIYDFDFLIQGLKEEKYKLHEILSIIRKRESNEKTKKLTFVKHLEEKYPNIGIPEYLINEFNNISNECLSKFI